MSPNHELGPLRCARKCSASAIGFGVRIVLLEDRADVGRPPLSPASSPRGPFRFNYPYTLLGPTGTQTRTALRPDHWVLDPITSPFICRPWRRALASDFSQSCGPQLLEDIGRLWSRMAAGSRGHVRPPPGGGPSRSGSRPGCHWAVDQAAQDYSSIALLGQLNIAAQSSSPMLSIPTFLKLEANFVFIAIA